MIHTSVVDLNSIVMKTLETVLDEIMAPEGTDVSDDALDLENLILDKFELALYRILVPMNESPASDCKCKSAPPATERGKQLLLDGTDLV